MESKSQQVDQNQQIKPKFISMAECMCSPVLAFIFDQVPGSQDRLMDVLQKGAPAPDAGKCKGKHHLACTPKYGCIGERRLLLPTPFAVWIAEAEQSIGVQFGVEEVESSSNSGQKRKVVASIPR